MSDNKFKPFIPDLSPSALRSLRKLFVKFPNAQSGLIRALESEINVRIPEENVSNLMHLSKNVISHQSCCSLFIDLLNAGWSISLSPRTFHVMQPDDLSQLIGENGAGQTMEQVKEKMRQVQLVNRNKQLRSTDVQKFVKSMETPKSIGKEKKSVLDLIDSGEDLSRIFQDILSKELDEDSKVAALQKIISPEIIVCYPLGSRFKSEQQRCPYTGLGLLDIWRYFRLTWSSEHKSVPGKSFPLLIRNAARPNKPIIGIAMLRSAALSDEARDNAIGWTNEQVVRNKIYAKEISVRDVVRSMLECLDEQIKALKIDHMKFLTPKLIKFPNEEVIRKLFQLHDQESEKRTKDLKDGKPVMEVNPIGLNSKQLKEKFFKEWKKPLFRKKVAGKLAKFLEVRKSFNEANIRNDPVKGYATLVHPSCKKGKEMISRALREVRIRALAENIMDVSVCGAVAPYNEILGGKLIASLIASREVRDLFAYRYTGKYRLPSIIASSTAGKPYYRDTNLMCLTTTSLYGIASSQYNRIKYLKKDFAELKEDLIWREVFKKDPRDPDGIKILSHKTKGRGTYHISDRTTKLLNALTLKKGGRVEVNHKFGEGSSAKLRKITTGLSLLVDQKVAIDHLLCHPLQRKNYILFYEGNMLSKLLRLSETYSSIRASGSKKIAIAWVKRWLVKRVARRQTLEKLKELGPNSVHKELFFDSPKSNNESTKKPIETDPGLSASVDSDTLVPLKNGKNHASNLAEQ